MTISRRRRLSRDSRRHVAATVPRAGGQLAFSACVLGGVSGFWHVESPITHWVLLITNEYESQCRDHWAKLLF